MRVYTFTMEATAGDVQAAIDGENQCAPGYLIARMPWVSTRGYEHIVPGDGAVIELAATGDFTCWIGDVEDVEIRPGSHIEVLIEVR